MIQRHRTREVPCGKLVIGGDHPIWVQSLTTAKTSDVEATKSEIRRMLDAGCEIVRVAVFDMADAQALGAVKKYLGDVPLVSDIHFNYKFALEAIEQGVDKVRLNPGNVGGLSGRFDDVGKERVKVVAEAAKKKGLCMRVGVNSGSVEKDLLDKYGWATADALVESAMRHCEWLEACGFRDVVVSLKSTNMETVIDAYLRFGKATDYPLHVGVTEAGLPGYGTLKSAIGIGRILLEGLGDTIRVSLTGDKALEMEAGFDILKATGRRVREPEINACPECGRIAIDLQSIVKRVKERIKDVKAPLKISILGCAVNGPGEAAEADIGVAGERGQGMIFKKGVLLRRVKESEMVDELEKEIRALANERTKNQ
ncbi:MAG TPA: flavodoxin-dependent (E)-4-hydroxy-3-methylbut-2-enyl-diphosphate synthase [Planctomycetota bacterium]|nr:flavodoxin-dependent (E)-4-hydroxy-3-methylbut-2-enyl-diphosphate synthase [Planctomycetota bacterium]